MYSFLVMNRGYVINRGHYLKRFVSNIRASKNISGLVKVTVTSPAGFIKFFLNVEPCEDFLGFVLNITCGALTPGQDFEEQIPQHPQANSDR